MGCMGPGCWEIPRVPWWLSLLTTRLTQQISLPYEAPETQTVHILRFLYPQHPTFDFLSYSKKKSCWLSASSQQMWGTTANYPGSFPQGRAWESTSQKFPYFGSHPSSDTCPKREPGKLAPEHLQGFNASRWELRHLSYGQVFKRMRVKGINKNQVLQLYMYFRHVCKSIQNVDRMPS